CGVRRRIIRWRTPLFPRRASAHGPLWWRVHTATRAVVSPIAAIPPAADTGHSASFQPDGMPREVWLPEPGSVVGQGEFREEDVAVQREEHDAEEDFESEDDPGDDGQHPRRLRMALVDPQGDACQGRADQREQAPEAEGEQVAYQRDQRADHAGRRLPVRGPERGRTAVRRGGGGGGGGTPHPPV